MASLSSPNAKRGAPIVLVTLALAALISQPLLAQAPRIGQPLLTQRLAAQEETGTARICPPPLSREAHEDKFDTIIKPLQPQERLLYSLNGLSGGTLEVRYRVNGELHLTEIIDLQKAELPVLSGSKTPSASTRQYGGFIEKQNDAAEAGTGTEAAQRHEGVDGERVIELLALQPDSVRGLLQLAHGGAAIDIEVLYDGHARETISFATLASRNAELRERPVIPVFAPSEVRGPGVVTGPRKLRVRTNTYLEDCNDCTSEMPCDTECGYDPGKGGPVTCGEYGAPCDPWCPASYNSGDYYTAWTYYSTGYGAGNCFTTSSGARWFNQKITTYRREHRQRTTTCPNHPSCNGCYETESLIAVQYSSSTCWEETSSSCGGASTPCCWASNCSVFGWSSCSNSFPCSY
jgi:hypothetical protein